MLVYGTEASEVLNGTEESDDIHGWGGHDQLFGFGGNDILTGGEDSDFMTGGTGADTFVFNFTVTTEPEVNLSFTDWLADQGAAPLADGVTTQSQFSTQYTAWLESLVATYGLGADLDGDGVVSVDLNQNDMDGTPLIEGMSQADLDAMFGERASLDVKTGKTMHERWYSDTFFLAEHECVTDSQGTDVVMDFSRAEHDNIQFNNVTAEQFAALFTVTEMDANSDGMMDTVITSECDPSFSITLVGYTGLDAGVDMQFDVA
jgi:Ca2+-binding RTX toxin-like protein